MTAEMLLRTSALLVAGLALRGLLRRRSAAIRHLVGALTLLGAALVVPASLVLPSWTVAVPHLTRTPSAPPSPEIPKVSVTATAVATAAPAEAAPALGSIVWTVGCLFMLATLAAGILRVRQIARRGTAIESPRWIDATRTVAASYGLRRDVRLIEAESPFVVATWGVWAPALLVPPGASRSWDERRLRVVLCHELAHVARADWLVQILSQIVLAILWFHPLAWLACRQLRHDSEHACDDAVLRRGVAAAEYASHVVALARVCRRPAWSAWMPALPMAHPSAFERRIAAMLNPRLDRRPLSCAAGTAFAALIVAMTCAVAAARPRQGPGELAGTVYDASGAVIPGVTLTLTQGQPPAVQATTDSAGRFSFPGIGPGHYVLSATLPGFRTLHDEFDLKTAADWDRAVTLQVGTLRETIHVSATRTAPPPPPTGPTRIRVGGNIKVPLKLKDAKPIYPGSMRAEGREAEVQLEATIAPDGSVSSVHVTSAQIHPDFAIAAIDAVRQWRFSPTLLNGKPIEVVMTVTVSFSLSD